MEVKFKHILYFIRKKIIHKQAQYMYKIYIFYLYQEASKHVYPSLVSGLMLIKFSH